MPLFLAGTAIALPPRDAVAALIGSEIMGEGRSSVLSGHLRSSDTAGDPGRTVCGFVTATLSSVLHRSLLS
jgi:hypothetical protein